jgi:hypothetical protein
MISRSGRKPDGGDRGNKSFTKSSLVMRGRCNKVGSAHKQQFTPDAFVTKTTFEKVAAGLLEAVASRNKEPEIKASTIVNIRVRGADLSALDGGIAAQPEPRPTRPEAIRYALRDWLISQGVLKSRDDPEGAN